MDRVVSAMTCCTQTCVNALGEVGGGGPGGGVINGGSCYKYNLVSTKVLSRQTRVCVDKHAFVATKKMSFVTTKVCVRQKKKCVATSLLVL